MEATELLRRIREIEIRTEHLANDVFAGQYLSAFKGHGMEFVEVRQYAPGDDVRTIDWRVSARAGRPYVRKYVEERELTVMLVVDASGSMQFGTQATTKAETMAETAATLAFSAIGNNDKVGLVVFSEGIDCYVPPRKGKRQVLRLIREVLYERPRGRATNLAAALEYVSHVLHRRAVVFVISDFLNEGYGTPLNVLSQRHDVICLRVEDPREAQMPPVGLLELEDAETGRRELVQIGGVAARRLAALALQRRATLLREITRLRADLIDLQAGQSPVEPLRAFFERRARRR
jgi:uncharacterized protein (DUF58 family)